MPALCGIGKRTIPAKNRRRINPRIIPPRLPLATSLARSTAVKPSRMQNTSCRENEEPCTGKAELRKFGTDCSQAHTTFPRKFVS